MKLRFSRPLPFQFPLRQGSLTSRRHAVAWPDMIAAAGFRAKTVAGGYAYIDYLAPFLF